MTQRDEKIKVRLVDQQSWIQGHTNDEIKSAQTMTQLYKLSSFFFLSLV